MRIFSALGALIVLAGCTTVVPSNDVSVKPIQPPGVTSTAVSVTTSTSATSTSGTTNTTITTTPRVTATTVSAPIPAPLAWTTCGQRIECSTLDVPLDYARGEGGGFINLKIKRRKASGDSLGPLLVNPGGPGVGGTIMVDEAQSYFDPILLDRFDLIAWDPRGTGQSEGMVCLDDLDTFMALDPTPDNQAERDAIAAADQAFADGCKARHARVLPFIGTEESARDIDQIRQALRVEQISYFGFSYGSRLGATYATLFPSRVRTMVIDGAEDPTASGEDLNLQQIVGFENAFATLLEKCASDKGCAFHHGGQPGPAFESLMVQLDKEPLLVSADRVKVNQGVAINAVAEVLYSEDRWPALTRALAAAEKGDGAGLLSLYDSYTRRNSPGENHLFDAFITITCLDNPGPTDAAGIDAFLAKAAAAAPRLGKYLTSPSNVCPKLGPKHARFSITGKGAGKILVVGTTGDPATPYNGTVTMAKTLEEGVLLTVKANQHTGYGANKCAGDAVDNVLVKLIFPPEGKICS